MKWQKCPICNGTGQVSAGYFNRAGDYQTRMVSNTIEEICQICKGKGIIIEPTKEVPSK